MVFIEKIFSGVLKVIYTVVSFILVSVALLIIYWSIWNIVGDFAIYEDLIGNILQSVGAIVISIAIIDVAKYMFEEEIVREKELRSPAEARKTLTKIFVIIAIALSLEGLVYIFKAGAKDITLLPYPALLIFTAILSMVGLGLYQKLSVRTEKEEDNKK